MKDLGWWGDGGSKGSALPSSGPKFLHFDAVFGKNWSNSRLVPPSELARIPLVNLDPPLPSKKVGDGEA